MPQLGRVQVSTRRLEPEPEQEQESEQEARPLIPMQHPSSPYRDRRPPAAAHRSASRTSHRCPPPLHKTGNRASSYSHHAHSAVNSKSLFECDSGTARHELCCAAGCAHPRINPSQPVGLKFCCIMRGIMSAPRDQHIDMMPQSAKTMRVKQQSVVVKRTNFMLHSVVQFKTAVCTAHNHPATSAR